ncbi:uncharacterized protein LOC129960861 [Argiope bruennichi]|uniref:DNA damage-regulated autophagy modulator like protein n=1 Tax=Argiope bruennichi TaxID=94029 RepID=A0A8T0FKX4_ARGBR|nr:uncharacterized protein LOC129960861 [Argiope bruennichi]KAF8791025.1 DNA damage-regulated autophagy modulator like protein [Argiope bruennichi]
MDGKGNDALLKTTKVTEWTLNNGGYISVAFGGLLLLGCIVAYVIAVARGNVEAILPLISDAAGSPPQNGLFGLLICLGGMFGVLFMIQRYMIVLEKNREKSSLVTAINRLSLFVGIISMLGITLITGYPVNFYRNRDVWLMDVGLPHMIGGVMLLSLGLCYISLQCILTLFLKSKNETVFSLRVLLLFICTAAFVYHMITVPENFGGISHLYYLNSTENELNYTGILPYPPTMGASLKLPIDTGGSYVASAISEWVFVIFFCCFFFTFFHEAQEYSMLIVIETHTTHEPEVIDDTKPDFRKLSLHHPQNGSQDISKPPPEVRKVLRRDSTCQTMTNALDDALKTVPVKSIKTASTKTSTAEGTNTSTKEMPNTEVDVKLTRLLSECDAVEDSKDDSKAEMKTTEQNVSTSCDDLVASNGNVKNSKEDQDKEEERIAIEKIDVVVKNAEEAATAKHDEDSPRKTDTEEAQPSNCPLSVQ